MREKKRKGFLKELLLHAPVLLLVVVTFILFTILGAFGKGKLYDDGELDLKKEPILSLVFGGIKEGQYPWQLLAQEKNAAVPDERSAGEEELAIIDTGTAVPIVEKIVTPEEAAAEKPADIIKEEETAVPEKIIYEEIKPIRETTYTEYINHISADIYGMAGVERAAEYKFQKVTEDYFNNALFVGDSRTVGIRDYAGLEDRADFLCETSATIYKILEHEFKNKDTLEAMLSRKTYGKIYLMVGINELGRGTTEDFIEQYRLVVDEIKRLAPDSIIILQGIIHVSKERNNTDPIFNNSNITARNHAIATLADNETVFYIDCNEVLCDEEGNLNDDYTYDDIHILGVHYHIVKEFLLEHGVTLAKWQ